MLGSASGPVYITEMFEAHLKKITGGLVASLIPKGVCGLDGNSRDAFQQQTSTAIFRRFEKLPTPTRIAIYVLTILFNLFSLVVIGKTFSSADDLARTRFIRLAGKIPVIPFADLIRLYRALTFLAVYNAPTVRRAINFPELETSDNLQHSTRQLG